MGTKIYVGNLNYETDEQSLRDLFTPHGEVKSVSIITDRYTGMSKGFAFVEMGTDEEASTAIGALNGTDLEGRTLRVDEARDRPRRRPERDQY
jgi:RNA recognition motif-containing protein